MAVWFISSFLDVAWENKFAVKSSRSQRDYNAFFTSQWQGSISDNIATIVLLTTIGFCIVPAWRREKKDPDHQPGPESSLNSHMFHFVLYRIALYSVQNLVLFETYLCVIKSLSKQDNFCNHGGVWYNHRNGSKHALQVVWQFSTTSISYKEKKVTLIHSFLIQEPISGFWTSL